MSDIIHPKESSENHHLHGSYRSYCIGFALSIALTLAAYFLVQTGLFGRKFLTLIIALLGILQTWVQLHFFLHIGQESQPRWNLMAFIYMAIIVFIIVGGSLWIMNNLDHRVMSMMMMDLKDQ